MKNNPNFNNINMVIKKFYEFLPYGADFHDSIDNNIDYKEKAGILKYLIDVSILKPWGSDGKYILSNIGESIVDDYGSIEKYLEDIQKEKNEKELLTRKTNEKLIHDAKLSKWQSKIFWPLFIIACVGGFQAIYSIADLIVGESLEQKVERILDIKIQEQQQKEKASTFQIHTDSLSNYKD